MSLQSSSGHNEFLKKVLEGDRVSVARAISLIEDEDPVALEILQSVYPHTGRAYRVGITGPPGAGKSTIANKLAFHYRKEKIRVGVIAVDPTSPFTGGALLGDRIRMTDLELDEGVFVRSMASRGSSGGLSKKASEAADILDAAGNEVILLETVGVGQSELDVAGAADTTAVILVPESGDSIQAMKAGLMEIADFIVLNKSDRPGADQAMASIQMVLRLRPTIDGWNPEVVKAVASEGRGIAEMAKMIDTHREFLKKTGQLEKKRRMRIIDRMRELIAEKLHYDLWTEERKVSLEEKAAEVLSFQTTPYDAAEEVYQSFQSKKNPSKA